MSSGHTHTTTSAPAVPLSAQAHERFAREVAKYPYEQRQSAVMACLAIAQQEQGFVSQQTEAIVAELLGMPEIAVREVTTFYNMYNLSPCGKYKLTVCTNLPCQLSGGEQAAEHLKEKLGIGFRETTADGRFTLMEGECMGACGDAPVLLVNNKRMESFMSNEKLDALIAELK